MIQHVCLLLKMVEELGRGFLQEADEFKCRGDLDPSVIFNSEIKVVMEDSAVFFPSRAVSH